MARSCVGSPIVVESRPSSGSTGPARPGNQPAGGQPGRARPRRDRRGRGLRGELAPRGVPLLRSRSENFDDLILDAVEELERHWAPELAGIEFAVEDVPDVSLTPVAEFDPQVIMDRGVPLGRLLPRGIGGRETTPVIVIYRRPLEARALDREDRGDLVFSVVAELVAEALGKDIDEIDPPRD